MKEIMIPYILLVWLLVKMKVIPWNLKSQVWSTGIGIFILFLLFTGSRYWAYVDITNTATVRAPQAILSPLVGQQVDRILVEHNQKVFKGDLIYTLVDVEPRKQAEAVGAQMSAIERKIEALITRMENDKKELVRLTRLGQYSSEQERDRLVTQIASYKAEVEAEYALIVGLTADLERVEFIRDRQEVKAPFDGKISLVNIASGSRLGNMHLYDTSRKFLEVRIADQFYGFIEKGAFCEFFIQAYPGHIFRGRVHSITTGTGEAAISPFQGDQPVSQFVGRGMASVGRTVIIEFDEPEGMDLPIGSVGSAWISGTKPTALVGFIDIIGAATVRLTALKAYFTAF